MRIKLDLEDRLAFATLSSPELAGHGLAAQYRCLVIKVGGKDFTVTRVLNGMDYYHMHDGQYIQEIDRALVAAMEQMLSKLLTDACAAVPVGVDLLPADRP